MKNAWAIIVLIFSSAYVLLLDNIALSSRGLQKSLVIPLAILLFIFYRSFKSSWAQALRHQGKWFLLLTGSIIIQTLVLSTGGLQSPFLILIHLFMIGMSFFLGFSTAVFFLILAFIVLLVDITFNQKIYVYVLANPSAIILQLVSLLSIIPIAYIISQQYHIKEVISTMLQEKVKTDEEIFKSLKELIIITDAELMILSVNDAVERTLQKPKSELQHTQLFNSLLLKDDQGRLVKKEMLLDKDNKPIETESQFTIINAPKEMQKVLIKVQALENLQNKEKQLSFILSSTKEVSNNSPVAITVEKARAKYEAMTQALKAILKSTNNNPAYNPLLFLEKIENDLYTVQSLQSKEYHKSLSNIDIAVLCRKLIDLENEFSKPLQVDITFLIENFGQKDVHQLTGEHFQIDPQKFTGPFFTLLCDAKNCEIVMTKLLDLSVFLASNKPTAQVAVTMTREGNTIVIRLKVPNPNLTKDDLPSLLVPDYANLTSKTNILAGSGLEGFLIQSLSEKMQTPIIVDFEKDATSYIVFTWALEKSEAKSGQGQ